MNGKREEKLAQLAFGELTPDEAQSLEREAVNDSEARRTLEAYKEMRDGLRGLAAVPDDQFSKERLRDAILTQGLRPAASRQGSNRSWVWMPFAACLIGFGVMYARNEVRSSNNVPEVVIRTGSVHTMELNPDIPMPKVAVAEKPTVINAINMRLRVHDRTRISSSRHRSRHRLGDGEEDPPILAGLFDDDSNPYGFYDGAPDSGKTSVAPPSSSSAPATSGPIVMIDQDKDEQTGAQKATEVNSASNVLVGG